MKRFYNIKRAIRKKGTRKGRIKGEKSENEEGKRRIGTAKMKKRCRNKKKGGQ